jgi:RNA polymerase-binding transcription factor DksA
MRSKTDAATQIHPISIIQSDAMAAKKTAKTKPAASSKSKLAKPAKSPAKAKPAAAKPAVAKKAPARKASSGVVKKETKSASKPAAKTAKPASKATVSHSEAKSVTVPTNGSAAKTSGAGHSSAFIQKQRQRLLDLRDELVDAMSGMTRDTIRNAPEGSEASGSGQHQGDAGSDAYDRDFALSVLAKEQDALYEIEQALRRIQLGSYGVCEISAKKIPQARLEAIPFARLTVECQAEWEKEYGNRRFRPSNEVGFAGGFVSDDEDSESVSLDEDDD